MLYKYKYLTVDRYDNYYISQDIKDLDEQRIKLDKDAVLPLTRMEANKFVEVCPVIVLFCSNFYAIIFQLTSWKLVKPEKKKLAKSGIFLFVTSVQMGSILMTDYFLFWLLDIIRRYGSNMKQPEGMLKWWFFLAGSKCPL